MVDDFAALGISFFLFPQHRQPNRVKSTLNRAGFKDIQAESMTVKFEWQSAEAFVEERRALSAPFRSMLSKQTPELQGQILAAMASAAGNYADASGIVRMDNEAICVYGHL